MCGTLVLELLMYKWFLLIQSVIQFKKMVYSEAVHSKYMKYSEQCQHLENFYVYVEKLVSMKTL